MKAQLFDPDRGSIDFFHTYKMKLCQRMSSSCFAIFHSLLCYQRFDFLIFFGANSNYFVINIRIILTYKHLLELFSVYWWSINELIVQILWWYECQCPRVRTLSTDNLFVLTSLQILVWTLTSLKYQQMCRLISVIDWAWDYRVLQQIQFYSIL